MSVKVRTWRRTRVYTGDSGVEIRVAPGRKSPFRFRREIISQRGNATGLSVTTIIVNNAAHGYTRATQMTAAVYSPRRRKKCLLAFLAFRVPRPFTAFDSARLLLRKNGKYERGYDYSRRFNDKVRNAEIIT